MSLDTCILCNLLRASRLSGSLHEWLYVRRINIRSAFKRSIVMPNPALALALVVVFHVLLLLAYLFVGVLPWSPPISFVARPVGCLIIFCIDFFDATASPY